MVLVSKLFNNKLTYQEAFLSKDLAEKKFDSLVDSVKSIPNVQAGSISEDAVLDSTFLEFKLGQDKGSIHIHCLVVSFPDE